MLAPTLAATLGTAACTSGSVETFASPGQETLDISALQAGERVDDFFDLPGENDFLDYAALEATASSMQIAEEHAEQIHPDSLRLVFWAGVDETGGEATFFAEGEFMGMTTDLDTGYPFADWRLYFQAGETSSANKAHFLANLENPIDATKGVLLLATGQSCSPPDGYGSIVPTVWLNCFDLNVYETDASCTLDQSVCTGTLMASAQMYRLPEFEW